MSTTTGLILLLCIWGATIVGVIAINVVADRWYKKPAPAPEEKP